jgi:hypothetical protein
MDTMQNLREHKTLAQIGFWKGIIVGTMAGMVIAAFKEIVDRILKEPKQPSHATALPDWRKAA